MATRLRPFIVPEETAFRHSLTDAEPVLPGLVRTVVVDHDGEFGHLPRSLPAAFSPSSQWLHETAVENLRALPPPELRTISADKARTDADLLVMQSADVYGASRFSCFPDLLADATGGAPVEHGVLVAMPDWHSLVLHVISGPGAAAAMKLMAQVGRTWIGGAKRERQLVPDVFYVAADGRSQVVARIEGDVLERYPTGPVAELGIDLFPG
ncbi:hypothetical protein O7599_01225 [Streptomyces sp. WMMC500]|uniref:hypothetical protein n=1 Tax=Streptomyces sp. WMMC500 TaxID=3015154 RepID=UPI00248ADD4C|nr:hypothetical protein [Streptomyces sp. WMMC500]WBB61211.1 hypothetical protein O7599_01225 [Streptomyces sp. WMMC500]